jgi:hypothetical protein
MYVEKPRRFVLSREEDEDYLEPQTDVYIRFKLERVHHNKSLTANKTLRCKSASILVDVSLDNACVYKHTVYINISVRFIFLFINKRMCINERFQTITLQVTYLITNKLENVANIKSRTFKKLIYQTNN